MLLLIVFLVVAFGLTAVLHVYLYWRLVAATTRDDRRRRWGKWLMAGLWLVLCAAGPLEALFRSSQLVGLMAAAAWTWLGLAALLATALAAGELLRGGARALDRLRPAPPARQETGSTADTPPSPERRLFLSRVIAGSAALASGGLASYGTWRAYTPPAVTELALKLPRLPKTLEGLCIVQVSDIHVGPLIQRSFMDDMVRRCNALRPDMVVVTGDLVDGDVPTLGPAVAALRDLRSRFGTYFITGNHEYYSGDIEWCAELERMGLTVLRNRRVAIGDAGGSFDLIGVDDWMGGNDGERKYDLEAATSGRDPSRPAVLLAHQPENFEEAAAKGIGLQLSGHTHGGQFFPMSLAIPLLWRWSAGHYTHRDSHIYVSRGTGFWGPPFRAGSPPEIVKLHLLAG